MLRRLVILAVVLLGALAPVAAAHAATPKPAPQQDVAVPLYPVTDMRLVPAGFSLSAGQALAEAKRTSAMQSLHRTHHPLTCVVMVMPRNHFEVDFFYGAKPLATVLVQPNGRVSDTFYGPLVLGLYARGHYSDVLDKPWVWLPLGLAFLFPILMLRGLTRVDRVDLAAVLFFGVSYALFDNTIFEPGVWLAYPPLLYLLARMAWRGFAPRARRRELRVALPTWALIAGVVILFGAEVAMSFTPSQVMDVGYASMVGALKVLHGQPIYFPSLGHPDTYGPVNYLAYVPFEALWPVKSWGDYVPGARIAALSFHLITILGLVALGRRMAPGRSGLRLGLTAAWLWAACPFTALMLIKSSNDGLVAMFMVLTLLAVASPVKRGLVLGLATAAKFTPAIALPLIAVGPGGEDRGAMRRALAAFVIVVGAAFALFLPPGGVKEVWQHTLGFQLSRPDIFSPWALHPGLAPVKDLVEVAVVGLALLVAFRPRGPRSLAQISALAAAVTIAIQLPALHWFYLYIDWFVPLVIVAVLAEPVVAPRVADPVPLAALASETDPGLELAGVS